MDIDQSAPTFAGGSAFLTPVWMNIRNIAGFGFIPAKLRDDQTVYYTRMIFQFDGPDGSNYRLVFDPDDADECPAGPDEYCNFNFGGPDPLYKNRAHSFCPSKGLITSCLITLATTQPAYKSPVSEWYNLLPQQFDNR